MISIATLIIGIVIGAVLVRYGIGLGTKIVYQVKEDLPILTEQGTQTDQAFTDETTDEELEKDEELKNEIV